MSATTISHATAAPTRVEPRGLTAALGVLAVAGLIALVLALSLSTGATARRAPGTSAPPVASPAQGVPGGYVRDLATHALLRLPASATAAPASAASQALIYRAHDHGFGG